MRCPHCRTELEPGNRYCPGCGRPVLSAISFPRVNLEDEETGRAHILRPGITRIGRDPSDNEIVLRDETVSARHAAIEVSPQAVVIRDVGSRAGTRVNGERIHRAVVLSEGDRVNFGAWRGTIVPRRTELSGPPRGIPTPVQPARQRRETRADWTPLLSLALATISLTILAAMLNGVGIVDAHQRDILPGPLVLTLLGLVGVPLAGVVMVAAGKRSGYLVTAIAALLGLAFIALVGPVFTGSDTRNELTDRYGSTGFWFLAVSAVAALVVEIVVLTVSIAGWRIFRSHGPVTPAPAPRQQQRSATHAGNS